MIKVNIRDEERKEEEMDKSIYRNYIEFRIQTMKYVYAEDRERVRGGRGTTGKA